jgi:hypothetical protein
MRDYLACGIGILILGFSYFLDAQSAFLYSGYAFIKALGCVMAVVFLTYAFVLVRRQRLGPAAATLLLSVAFLISGWILGTIATTPRKRFYLLAERIRPNDTLNSVRAKLSGYSSWSRQEGYISFSFASGPGTSDVVVIHYDPKTAEVLSSDLSLD